MSGLDETSTAIGSLTARIGAVERDLRSVRDGQDKILAILNRAQGSWKTILVVASLIAAVGGAISFIVDHIKVMLK